MKVIITIKNVIASDKINKLLLLSEADYASVTLASVLERSLLCLCSVVLRVCLLRIYNTCRAVTQKLLEKKNKGFCLFRPNTGIIRKAISYRFTCKHNFIYRVKPASKNLM